MGAGAVVENADAGGGALVLLALFYCQMLIGESGDLRQVGDAQDLLGAAEGFEFVADGFGGAASDADVDFVEDEGARGGFFLGFGRRLFNGHFKGEEDAGELAARGDFGEGLEGFAGVGRDEVGDGVPALSGPCGRG